MSWECPTCGAQRSCWGPEIFHGMLSGQRAIPRDVVLEAASQGLVNALAALAEHPRDIKPAITYFEASPTKDPECAKRWLELNTYVDLVKKTLYARQDRAEVNGEAAP